MGAIKLMIMLVGDDNGVNDVNDDDDYVVGGANDMTFIGRNIDVDYCLYECIILISFV